MAEFVQTTLMDSYAGGPHITEAQLGLAHQATFGPDDYVLEGGRESEAQVLTNNSIRIFDAVYCIQGRRDVIPASGYTDVTIANGTQGMNRNDIIVRRYKKNESSEIESTEYAVIKGTPNAGAAVDPEVTTGDIRSGATLHEMALYRVKITGLNITAVEPMFNILKNMASLQKEFAELNSNFKIYSKFITSKPWASVNSDNYETRKYRRSGNLVMLEYLANFNTDGTLSFNLIEQSIPQGYRPVTTVYLPFVQTSGANVIGHGCLRLSPDGTSYMSLTEPGFTEHGGTLMYFTNDPFPKD